MKNKRISPMKGKRHKLVDLPEGAKARKSKRTKKRQIAKVVKDVVILNNKEEVEQGTSLVVYDDKENIDRALKTQTDIEVPELLLHYIHLVRDVQANYRRFLREYYKKLDQGKCESGLEYATLHLAIVAAKIDHGSAEDVITPYIKKTEQFTKSYEETIMTNTEQFNTDADVAKKVNDLFISRQQQLDRTRNIAMATSAGASLAASAAEMLISGEMNTRKMAIAAGSAALSVGTTSVVMNAFDDGGMTSVTGAAVGGGVGLVIGGAASFADYLLKDSQVEE